MREIFVLDACALLALVKKEKGADIVSEIYKKARRGDALLYMSRVNLLEVYYGFYRDMGHSFARDIIRQVESSPVLITDFDRDVFWEAGRLKGSYKMSLADAIAIAQTIILRGSILTADHHEFDVLESKEPLHFTWIR